jgi:hypothetical protein
MAAAGPVMQIAIHIAGVPWLPFYAWRNISGSLVGRTLLSDDDHDKR